MISNKENAGKVKAGLFFGALIKSVILVVLIFAVIIGSYNLIKFSTEKSGYKAQSTGETQKVGNVEITIPNLKDIGSLTGDSDRAADSLEKVIGNLTDKLK